MVCPFCAEQVQEAASICKHCGKKIKPVTADKVKRRKSVRPLIWILLICAVGVMMAATMSVENTTPADPCAMAYIKSKRFVEQSLKSPSTADFPSIDYNIVNLGNNECKVTSYVDSQNGFGAQLRSNWQTIVQSDDSGNWTLNELIVDGEQVYPKLN